MLELSGDAIFGECLCQVGLDIFAGGEGFLLAEEGATPVPLAAAWSTAPAPTALQRAPVAWASLNSLIYTENQKKTKKKIARKRTQSGLWYKAPHSGQAAKTVGSWR